MSNLLNIDEMASLFACPRCRAALIRTQNGYSCTSAACVCSQESHFGYLQSYPVLVDFDNSILGAKKALNSEDIILAPSSSSDGVLKKIARKVLFPKNTVAAKNITRLINLAKEMSPNPTVLVVGCGSIGSGIDAIYNDPAVRLIGFDIYGSPATQFIADAHQIPLRDQCVDAVVVQAVLEHVLDPWRVVAEIHRVLKTDGLVYGETPFMQQVHAGAYDFTRFTESGHRYLFRKFTLIESGVVQGPGTQLLWTIENVGRSVFRSMNMGVLLRLMFFWLRYIDRITPAKYAVDDACGVFFLGRKSAREVMPKEMVDYYKGAQ
jgi:SAM-dependent methyltransferase